MFMKITKHSSKSSMGVSIPSFKSHQLVMGSSRSNHSYAKNSLRLLQISWSEIEIDILKKVTERILLKLLLTTLKESKFYQVLS